MDNRYGSYGDEISCRKSPVDRVDRERYSDLSSSHGHHSPETKSFYDHHYLPSSSYDSPKKRYVKSPTSDLSRVKYHSTDVISDNDLAVSGVYKSTMSRSSLNDSGGTDFYCNRDASTALPRKYGSTVSGLQPKSVEYYEEILSPSNPDYLSPRDTCRSPLLDDYLGRCENGYHNNIADLSQFGTDRQRSYADRMTDVMELGEGNSKLFGEQESLY